MSLQNNFFRVLQKLLVTAPLHDFDSRILRPKERREYNLNPADGPRKNKTSNSVHSEKQKIALPKVLLNFRLNSSSVKFSSTDNCKVLYLLKFLRRSDFHS